MWVAAHPWGPWSQVHEETAWTPGNDPKALAYSPQIAPKWIAEDGKSFWLVWSDLQQKHTEACRQNHEAALRATNPTELTRVLRQGRDCAPYYAFNAQRVDLVIA